MSLHQVFCEISKCQFLEISGPDALDYLHRITTSDVKLLKKGNAQRSTLLTGTGKLILFFNVLCIEPTRYLLVFFPGQENPLPHFEKFHFAEDLELHPIQDQWKYYKVLSKESVPLETLISSFTGFYFESNHWSKDPWQEQIQIKFDYNVILDSKQSSAFEETLTQSGFQFLPNLNGYRILAGEPMSPFEANTSTIPIELHLDDALSEQKGCYPGQEVIERIRTQGQPPRKLVLVKGEQSQFEHNADLLIEQDGQWIAVGKITSAAKNPYSTEWVGLALISKRYANAKSHFKLNNQPVTIKV